MTTAQLTGLRLQRERQMAALVYVWIDNEIFDCEVELWPAEIEITEVTNAIRHESIPQPQ